MAFTVEDGTGKPNANSYADVAFADSYFADRGITDWTNATPTVKQAALIAASDYATQRWGSKLSGVILVSTQSLSFPRYGCYDRNGVLVTGVPDRWKFAICEYALQYIKDALYPTVKADDTRVVTSESVTVGPIKTAKSFSTRQPIRFPKADGFARFYIAAPAGVIR